MVNLLTIEDSEVVEGEMLLNAPEVSHVSITAVTFEQTMLDLRAPPKSHGPINPPKFTETLPT